MRLDPLFQPIHSLVDRIQNATEYVVDLTVRVFRTPGGRAISGVTAFLVVLVILIWQTGFFNSGGAVVADHVSFRIQFPIKKTQVVIEQQMDGTLESATDAPAFIKDQPPEKPDPQLAEGSDLQPNADPDAQPPAVSNPIKTTPAQPTESVQIETPIESEPDPDAHNALDAGDLVAPEPSTRVADTPPSIPHIPLPPPLNREQIAMPDATEFTTDAELTPIPFGKHGDTVKMIRWKPVFVIPLPSRPEIHEFKNLPDFDRVRAEQSLREFKKKSLKSVRSLAGFLSQIDVVHKPAESTALGQTSSIDDDLPPVPRYGPRPEYAKEIIGNSNSD